MICEEIPLERKALTYKSKYIEAISEYETIILEVRFSKYDGDDCGISRVQFRPIIKLRKLIDGTWINNKYNVGYFSSSNSFQYILNHKNKSAKLGPKGNVLINDNDLKSRGIGSYCMFQLLLETKLKYGGYTCLNGDLSEVDTQIEINHKRRNDFYNKVGYKIEGDKSGSILCDNLNDLSGYWNKEKIKETSIDDIIVKYGSLYENFSRLESNQERKQEIFKARLDVYKNIYKYKCFVLIVLIVILFLYLYL